MAFKATTMKGNLKHKPIASPAKVGAKITYDPKLDTYNVRPSAKLEEAKKIFALWNFKSFREEYEKTHGK